MPIPGFSIRPATEDDLGKLLEIETRVYTAPWSLQNFQSELTKPFGRLLVMTDDETDETIAGYMVLWLLLDEAQVLNLAVDTPFRRRGIGREMIRCMVNMAVKQGARRVVLDVRKSNAAAIQLYQSAKFSITQVRKRFYSDGEDAYTMSLDLTDKVIEF